MRGLGATSPCSKCGKFGYYKLGICRACRTVICIKCGKPLMKKYEGHKLCHQCKRCEQDRLSRLGE